MTVNQFGCVNKARQDFTFSDHFAAEPFRSHVKERVARHHSSNVSDAVVSHRILPAYQHETPSRDRIAAIGMFASSAWICSENTSLVSQAGCFDPSHSAFKWRH